MKDYRFLHQLDIYLAKLKRSALFDKSHDLLSDSDINILFCLYYNEGNKIKSTDIAKTLDVTLAAITYKVNSLVKRGYVEKEPAPNDLRITYIRLSKAGKELISKVILDFYHPIVSLTDSLGDHDVEELLRILKKISLIDLREGKK